MDIKINYMIRRKTFCGWKILPRCVNDFELVYILDGYGEVIINDVVEYDFDTPISNPIDYKRVLDNWNLLNTIASTFGMFFEGDMKKYTKLYDLLFRLNTPIDPISPTYNIGDQYLGLILKVFRKKDRFLERFELYIG